jgi:uncharacterized protein involved in exopolysaccharide biosynthesis
MRRALEIVFRQRRRFLLLLVLLPALSLVLGFLIPRPYQASATLWAAKRYEVTDATWVSEWYNMLGVNNTVPAQAQAQALMELLNSRAFDLQIASATDLPRHVSTSTFQQRDDALFADISRNVKVQADGNNLVSITYTNADPHIALQVVTATIQTFALTSQQLAVQSAQELLAMDQTQLDALQRSVADAEANLQAYVDTNPGLRNDTTKQANDSQYQFLIGQLTSAKKNAADVQAQIAQLQLQLTTIGGQADVFFSVQDAAVLVPLKTSRTQILLLALAVGLAIALVISAVYLALLTRADRSIYSEAEIETALSVPVLAEIPVVAFAPPVRTIFAAVEGDACQTDSATQLATASLAGGHFERQATSADPSAASR